MTDPLFLVARDALLVLLASVVLLVVFWRLTNTKFSITYEARTVIPEPPKADIKRVIQERDAHAAQVAVLSQKVADYERRAI